MRTRSHLELIIPDSEVFLALRCLTFSWLQQQAWVLSGRVLSSLSWRNCCLLFSLVLNRDDQPLSALQRITGFSCLSSTPFLPWLAQNALEDQQGPPGSGWSPWTCPVGLTSWLPYGNMSYSFFPFLPRKSWDTTKADCSPLCHQSFWLTLCLGQMVGSLPFPAKANSLSAALAPLSCSRRRDKSQTCLLTAVTSAFPSSPGLLT